MLSPRQESDTLTTPDTHPPCSAFTQQALDSAHLYAYYPLEHQPTGTEINQLKRRLAPQKGFQNVVFPHVDSFFGHVSLRAGLAAIAIIQLLACFISCQLVLASTGRFGGPLSRLRPAHIREGVSSPFFSQMVCILEGLQSRIVAIDFENWYATLMTNYPLVMWRLAVSSLCCLMLLVTLRCFSVLIARYAISFYLADAVVSFVIMGVRIYFYFSDPEYRTPHWLLQTTYLAAPLGGVLFNVWVAIHIRGFIRQQQYILAVLASEWPQHYGSKYYFLANGSSPPPPLFTPITPRRPRKGTAKTPAQRPPLALPVQPYGTRHGGAKRQPSPLTDPQNSV